MIAGKLLNLLAYCLLDEGKPQEAIELWDEAVEIFEKFGDQVGVIHCQSGLMCGYFNLGLYDECIECGTRGVRLAQESGDDQLLLLVIGNIAYHYFLLEKYEEAKDTIDLVRCLKEPEVEGNKIALDQLEAGIHLIYNELESAKFFY